MKQITHSFKLCLLIGILAHWHISTLTAQAYNPMQFGNTRWHYRMTDFGPINKSYCYFSMDTVGYYFQGKKYWRIEKNEQSTYSPTTNGKYIFDDTSTRTVYIIDTTTNVKKILYDFAGNTGDTVFGVFFNDTVKIDSVKYISYYGISRKHLFVHSIIGGHPTVWIEGIGSSYDFFMPGITYTDPEFGLVCQEVNNQLQIGDSLACKTFLTSVADIYPTSNLQIYPNPASSYLNITLDANNTKNTTLQICDAIGQLVYAASISYLQSSISINVSSFKNGIYFLKYKGINKKMIVYH